MISIHSPRMGRDGFRRRSTRSSRIISIHSPRMGRDAGRKALRAGRAISIHSPRMGRDQQFRRVGDLLVVISIHSPRMGRDCSPAVVRENCRNFNPLSPHGERRHGHNGKIRTLKHFNPLSPHGERLYFSGHLPPRRNISIHSPRMGRDRPDHQLRPHAHISIHSPRMGRDICRMSLYSM